MSQLGMSQPGIARRQPVPRGLARTGPVLFSYGFRPFFFGAGIWAVAAMGLWIVALATGWDVGGSYGGVHWHAHEMLFGYSSAALAGFLLTAVPNWTGRLPVSGSALMVLFGLWCAGRLTLLAPDTIGLFAAIGVDMLFLPVLALICAREIVVGRKWKDLKILGAVGALALANAGMHLTVVTGGDTALMLRLAVGAYIVLISIMGGRVVPSFTRNWLARRGATRLPVAYNRFDSGVLLVGGVALAIWVIWPLGLQTALACLLAGALHLVRLYRWRGWDTGAESLVLVLHLGYGFVPLGFAAIAATALGWLDPMASLHVFTVGAIGTMTLAIMSRATRGHTGLPLAASRLTGASYILVIGAGFARPLTTLWPDVTLEILVFTGLCWITGFVLYLVEYGPVLWARRRDRGK